MKTVIAGDPHSGKSVFVAGLKDACKKAGVYPYVITAAPDGEGSWFQETVKSHPELAKNIKENYKSKFSQEFVQRIHESVKNIKLQNVFIDIGGRVSPENYKICEYADSIIILCPSSGDFGKWEKFAQDLKLEIIAKIVSDYSGKEDTVNQGSVITGTIHYLERGEDITERPMIKAITSKLTGKIIKCAYDWVGLYLQI
jgi:CRISPR-associated protein Csx3